MSVSAKYGIVGFAVGMALGGVIMRRFKIAGRTAALWVAISSFLAIAIATSKVGLACDSVVNQIGKARELNPTHSYINDCNAGCHCERAALYPVCDRLGKAYYSPCHAGCQDVNITDREVRRDWCKDDCDPMIVVYFAFVICGGFIGGLSTIPGVLIVLRSVPQQHRSISFGFSGLIVSLFATLPSPFLWGLLVDTTCLHWGTNCEGGQGTCRIYNSASLRIRMHAFYGTLRLISLITDVWVWYHATDLKLISEEEEKDEPKTIQTAAEQEDEDGLESIRRPNEESVIVAGEFVDRKMTL